MAGSTGKKNTRSRSRERYRDRNNVAEKWLDQYGNMSLEGDYSRNQSCLQETFNMVDIVMENTVNEYLHTHIPEKERKEEYKTWYQFKNSRGEYFDFYYPTSFAARTAVLRQMGYPLPGNLDAVRKLRNETAHGNRTVVLQNRSLDYEVIRKAMVTLADVLILTGMLDPELREPSFERMRVREGDTLQKGAYTVGTLIGEGGMSRVYEGVQKHMNRPVAIKELKPGTYSRNRTAHDEAILLLQHDNIPHVYDMFFENGTYYMVLSYVNGTTLENYVARYHPIPMKMVIAISNVILDILSYLHSPEIRLIHGDLSPDNILIDGDGAPWLIDFGISGEIRRRLDTPAAAAAYLAPEVFAGSIPDERSDVYSFGCLLRYMLTGRLQTGKAGSMNVYGSRMEHFSDLIGQCTARDPENRFQSIAAVKESFAQCCERMERKKSEWQEPGWQEPGWKEPEWKEPEWKEPEWKEPEWKEPEWKEPDRMNPGWREADRRGADLGETDRRETNRREIDRREIDRRETEWRETELRDSGRQESARKEKARRKKTTGRLVLTCVIAGAAVVVLIFSLSRIRQTGDDRDAEEVTAESADAAESTNTANEVLEAKIFSGGNAVSASDKIPDASQISTNIVSDQSEEYSEDENVTSVFLYSYDSKTLTVDDPVDKWYLALINWQDIAKRNILLAVSDDPDVFEFAAFFCSPCILNGDISTIGCGNDNGVYKKYTFHVEDGVLNSCDVEDDDNDSSYTIIYQYASGNLVHMYTENGKGTLVDCIAHYDEQGKMSALVCNDSLYTITHDGNGCISRAEKPDGSGYKYSYDSNEVNVKADGGSSENEEDSWYVLGEDGTLASCQNSYSVYTYNYSLDGDASSD